MQCQPHCGCLSHSRVTCRWSHWRLACRKALALAQHSSSRTWHVLSASSQCTVYNITYLQMTLIDNCPVTITCIRSMQCRQQYGGVCCVRGWTKVEQRQRHDVISVSGLLSVVVHKQQCGFGGMESAVHWWQQVSFIGMSDELSYSYALYYLW